MAAPVAVDLKEKPADLDYSIRPGDIVQIDVYDEPDLTTRQRVSQNGVISMPLIGSVQIAGKTAVKGAAAVAELLNGRYVLKPYVTISVLSYAPRRVTVLGQVRTPGNISIPEEESLSLPEAIAMAGGPTDIGNLKKIILTRKVDGKAVQTQVNALAPDAGDIEIREGDILNVSETIF